MTFSEAKALFESQQLPLCETHYRQFQIYLETLVETNRYMNLTAITDLAEVWAKHFLDSAMLLRQISVPLGGSVLDVGTGAGFPGMVIAILRPDLRVTLLDSLQKRVTFLEETAAALGVSQQVTCIHSRAEDAAKLPRYREQFDLVTARAVAELPVLTEYCLPFVAVGGVFAAMKGPSEHAGYAEAAAEILGGDQPEEISYCLDAVGERRIIRIRKRAATPEKYPRRSDKIKKNPLQ